VALSDRKPSLAGLLAVSLLLTALSAQSAWQRTDFETWARKGAVAAMTASLPRGEFSPFSMTLLPVIVGQKNGPTRVFPYLGLQWWVSPNLAFTGGMTQSVLDEGIAHTQVIGLRLLSNLLAAGPFTPELSFSQGRMDGLAAYTSKWNLTRWAYDGRIGPWNLAVALVLFHQKVFPHPALAAAGVPGRFTLRTTGLALSGGYDLRRWLRISGKLFFHAQAISGGAQLSLAI